MRVVFILTFIVSLAAFGSAQKTATTARSTSNVSPAGNLQAGTQIAAQLQNSLDVRNARVGDQVVLKATQTVKQNGRVVISKGATLVGRVTEVQQRTRGNAASRIGVVFDRLNQSGNQIPISAVITSITQTNTALGDDLQSDTYASTSTRASTRSSNGGGLLGGVGNTVGSVVNSTTQTVGGVTTAAGQTVGNTTNTVGETLKGIQISQSANASAGGGSTLSLTGGNIHLEKGTTFNLSLSESVSK